MNWTRDTRIPEMHNNKEKEVEKDVQLVPSRYKLLDVLHDAEIVKYPKGAKKKKISPTD